MKDPEKTVSVLPIAHYDALCPLADLVPINIGHERISTGRIEELMHSFEHHGFVIPVYVWKCPDQKVHCVTGFARITALKKMAADGWNIPDIPVIFIEADSAIDAVAAYLNHT